MSQNDFPVTNAHGIRLSRFDYPEYLALLRSATAGRTQLQFSGAPKAEGRWLLIRHDVDYSVEAALQKAEVEAAEGYRSTFFFQLACQHYNLLSTDYAHAPHAVASMGHEVGLHYDVRALERWGVGDRSVALERELETLGSICGAQVKSISMHNPSVYGKDPFSGYAGLVNAYDLIQPGVSFYSDSCGSWRDEAYARFKSGLLPERLQLLIHPIFWAARPGDRWSRLNAWTRHRRKTVDSQAVQAKRLWARHSGVLEHDAREKLNGN